MKASRVAFPKEVTVGSVSVKIYRVRNKAFRTKSKSTTKGRGVRKQGGQQGGEVGAEVRQERVRFSFMVSYFADGKRRQKMFAQFDEAVAEAKAKAVVLSRGELDALSLSAVDARAYVHCVAMAKEAGLPLELLVKDACEAVKVLGGKVSLIEVAREYARRKLHMLPDKMLPDAVNDLLDTRAKDGTSEAYLKALKVYLKPLKEAFHCQLRAVTTGQLSDYFRALEMSPRSRNNARATVGAFFTFCKERGWLPRDHEGVTLVPKFKEQATDITIYSPWEMAQLLRFARPELVPFLAIGGFAGLRTAEIERLDWTEVHLKERFIEVKASKSKTASRRLAPVSDNLAAWLETHAQEHGRVVPFENLNKQFTWLIEDANEGLKKKTRGRGDAETVQGSRAKGKGGAREVRWKKNALRHSFISYRVAEIQDVAQVALEAGNSPQIIFQHYRELVRLQEAKEWFGITPPKEGDVIEMPAAEAA